MGRYSYDDMPPEGYREHRESGKRGTFVIAFVGILVTLIAIIIYLMYTPLDQVTAAEADAAAAESVEAVEDETGEEIPAEINATEMEAPAQPQPESVVSAVRPLETTEYIVSEGDTLITIADKFGVKASTIKDYNRISDVKVAPGSIIEIPAYSGTVYTVKEGDTLEDIAESYNPELSADDLAALNELSTTAISADDEIFIPEVGSDIAKDDRFSSPVPDGRVIRHYGEFYKDKGETVEGVVIASLPGSPVLSAGEGTVSRVGMTAERRRFIQIDGSDGYSAIYMDIESPLVQTGSSVAQGSIIGMIGSSSRYYGEPAILFSLSQDGVSLDPEDLIGF